MTSEQLGIAEKHQVFDCEAFGFDNVARLQSYIEKLNELDLEPASFDIIISNCVVNLLPDKNAVFKGVYNLLKEGGEFYFSDAYVNRRIPKSLQHESIWYWNDFLTLSRQAGFLDPR